MSLLSAPPRVVNIGLEQFASDLRRLPFPFTKQVKNTSIEIFHTSHNRFETHAPMRLLEPARVLRDEGFFGAIRFAANLLLHPDALRRVLAMRAHFDPRRPRF